MATMSVEGITVPEDETEKNALISTFEGSLVTTASIGLKEDQRVLGVEITSIGGQVLRKLHETMKSRVLESIEIQYEVTIEELCTDQSCSDGDGLADRFAQQVISVLSEEVNSGNFVQTVKQIAVQNNVSVAGISVAPVTAASFFE